MVTEPHDYAWIREIDRAIVFNFTFVGNFRIIGQGPGNNFLMHEVAHTTINANGDVTVTFDNLTIDCT